MSSAFIDSKAVEDNEEDFSGDEDGRRVDGSVDDEGSADSSEEEEDDEDEEAAKAVREGFIVESDEEEGDVASRKERIRRKRKRRKQMEEEREALDEEDLDLVLENRGESRDENTYRRLKRRRQGDPGELFSDDEDEQPEQEERPRRGGIADEFADFIEDDEFPEDEEAGEAPRAANEPTVQPETIGISADDAEQVYEIFGNGEDYAYALDDEEQYLDLEDRANNLALKDVFEPSELSEKMLTDFDEMIRITDEPERFQLARPRIAVDIEPETQWIATRLPMRNGLSSQFEAPYKIAISHVLNFMDRDNVEVPFIWHHRRDYLDFVQRFENEDSNPEIHNLLNQDDLWRIIDLDRSYRSFQEKKNNLKKFMDSVGFDDQELREYWEACSSGDEINDLQSHLYFRYAERIHDSRVVFSKRPPTKTNFSRYKDHYVYGLVKAYGITSYAFGRNLLDQHKTYFADDVDEVPIETAKKYVDDKLFPEIKRLLRREDETNEDFEQRKYLQRVNDALSFARYVMADEFFHDVRVRKAIRSLFFAHGTVTVKPTDTGKTQIDNEHHYYRFKYMSARPLRDFDEDPSLFLSILAAEREGLVESFFNLENEDSHIEQMLDFLQSDNTSEAAAAWNVERRQLLDAVLDLFRPLIKGNLIEHMKDQYEIALGMEVRQAALSRFNQMPYLPKSVELTPGEKPRVMAITNGRGRFHGDAIICVFVDEDGRPLDHVKISSLQDEGKDDFVEFLNKRKPDVIGIAGFSIDSDRLRRDIETFLTEEYSGSMDVTWVRDEVARFYYSSKKAETELPDMPPLARYCVGIARYLQSPLNEYVSMGDNISAISFSPHQSLLSRNMVHSRIESALVDIVNLVGVDINEALRSPSVASLLPYVSGLGPRKTQSIMKRIQSTGGSLSSRTELITRQIVTRNVFMNCASFFRIENTQSSGSDILDTTRIHNEDYELAKKMSSDALDLDEEDLMDFEEPSGVVSQLINDNETDKLDDLVLEEYADQLEKTFHHLKRTTLEQIREELKSPYRELRKPFVQLSESEVFTMLTGETDETLRPGIIVPATVRKVTHSFAAARLESGLEANVAAEDISDEFPPSVRVGQTVPARVLLVDKSRYIVDLDLKISSIQEVLASKRELDKNQPYWDSKQEEADLVKLQKRTQQENKAVRVIKHPLFKVLDAKQAESWLAGLQRGDVVIRPSSHGSDHIAVTWKVSDGIYQHLDVLELDKLNEFSVGRTLRVGKKYTYSDLDELIVMHVKATARKIEEMVHHEKFQKGSREDTEKWLERYSEANPRRSIYAFCFDRQHPGYFDLCFKANLKANIHSWPVKAVPNAFLLRDNIYGDMNTLCNGFKLLFSSAQKQQQQQQY